MARLKKEELIEQLKAAGIEASDDEDYWDLCKKYDDYQAGIKPEEKEEKPKEKPLVVPVVPCGVSTINDHEKRICQIERKLGLK